MARKVTKSVSSATIFGFDPSKDFETGEDGFPIPNVVISADGNPTDNKARLLLEKHTGNKNVMVIRIEVDETKLSVGPNVFVVNSSPCIEGETYGREYITQTFKRTYLEGFYIDGTMHTFQLDFVGTSTPNKNLALVRTEFGVQAVITKTEVVEERRFMTREKYLELAR